MRRMLFANHISATMGIRGLCSSPSHKERCSRVAKEHVKSLTTIIGIPCQRDGHRHSRVHVWRPDRETNCVRPQWFFLNISGTKQRPRCQCEFARRRTFTICACVLNFDADSLIDVCVQLEVLQLTCCCFHSRTLAGRPGRISAFVLASTTGKGQWKLKNGSSCGESGSKGNADECGILLNQR